MPLSAAARDVPTLEVPAPLYDEALAFCNARLRERGEPEIAALPPGEPWDVTSCPCAVGSKTCVDTLSWWRDDGERGDYETHGHRLKPFIEFFDTNAPRNVGPVLPVRVEVPRD